MAALVQVVLPVFLVIGFGYLARWKLGFRDDWVQGVMQFAQNFAVPVLIFRALSTLELGANFDPALLISFYSGAVAGFAVGLLGARFLFGRTWEESVAIGFATLFSNALLLGLPITERAYGAEALGSNFAIIAIHAPVCYLIGVTAMEIVRADGKTLGSTVLGVAKTMSRNPLVIGIGAGILANLTGLSLPGAIRDAVDLVAQAALPAALFGLGGALATYKPEGDMRVVIWIAAVSLVLHPTITWLMGKATGLSVEQFRSAVLTASMAPGMNAFLFANMYGVSKRVNATAVLVATAAAIVTVWVWLHLLP